MTELAPYVVPIAGLIAFYMAWNIGANDVANAMGTSLGSGALTYRRAIVLAAIFEFSGALLVGGSVTNTVRKGLVDVAVFAGEPALLVIGMLGALLAAGVWLHLATYMGWPVSTTHSIVGAVVGFGVAAGGLDVIRWGAVAKVSASWIVSPLLGGALAFMFMRVIEKRVLKTASPAESLRRLGPPMVAILFFVLSLTLLFKGLKPLDLDLPLEQALMASGLLALVTGLASIPTLRKVARSVEAQEEAHETDAAIARVERFFCSLQIITACFVAFAHGSNDVANAVGPLAAIRAATQETLSDQVAVPAGVMLVGAIGIVVGLATYGYKIMATVGEKITDLTPVSGFSAEFGAATTIVLASKLALPVSTTHTLVGAVIGVGLARKDKGVDWTVLRGIAASWIITVPLAGLISALIFVTLRAILL